MIVPKREIYRGYCPEPLKKVFTVRDPILEQTYPEKEYIQKYPAREDRGVLG